MTSPAPTWQSLQQAADHARMAGAHERAVDLYTAALALPAVPWTAVYALRIARAISWAMLGDFDAMQADLVELAAAADTAGDDAALAAVLVELAFRLRLKSSILACQEWARQAVAAANRTNDLSLQVAALWAQSMIQIDMGELRQAEATLAAAEAILAAAEAILAAADPASRLRIAMVRSYLALRLGNLPLATGAGEEVVHLARAHAWPEWEAFGINLLANAETDLARRGLYLEELLAAWSRLGDRPNQCVALSNISIWYTMLGMYDRVIDVAGQALHLARSLHLDVVRAFILQSLAATWLAVGQPAAALAHVDEGAALAQRISSPLLEFSFRGQQALALLCQGEVQQALAVLQTAAQMLADEPPPYAANRLSYTALAARLAGDWITAEQQAQKALSLVRPEDAGNPEWAIETIYWYCYRAMVPERSEQEIRPLNPAHWQILEGAARALLVPIDTLSDAGLRRIYLHRPWDHRLILAEWLKWAPQHAGPAAIAEFIARVQRPGRLDEIFRRLVAVGVRLNTQRDPNRLAAQIVDEVAELTGAERIALVILDEEGQRRPVKVSLPLTPPAVFSGVEPVAPDEAAFVAEIEPFLAEAAMHQQGFVRQLARNSAAENQRSALVAPLISRSRLVGLVYCDLAGCFGRFELEDLDLLGVLANQSAVAIENADWSAMLEEKVAQRTADLAEMAAALRAANADLEQRVAARTAELTHALEELRRAGKLKDEFMAAVSHELRTPLTGVLAMAEALQDGPAGPLTERQARYVGLIYDSGARLLSLVNRILAYANLISGRVEIHREQCSLDELCTAAVRSVSQQAGAKTQVVTVWVDPPDLAIVSDSRGIVEVLKHLLDNAVKFTPDGGCIGLEVGWDDEGTCIHLAVWDTGAGISAEQMDVIFQPFQQMDASLHRRHGGVGLGLAYVQRMVELLGGTLALESRPGEGSRFTVTLPTQPSHAG